jgi:hypothetical protein
MMVGRVRPTTPQKRMHPSLFQVFDLPMRPMVRLPCPKPFTTRMFFQDDDIGKIYGWF